MNNSLFALALFASMILVIFLLLSLLEGRMVLWIRWRHIQSRKFRWYHKILLKRKEGKLLKKLGAAEGPISGHIATTALADVQHDLRHGMKYGLLPPGPRRVLMWSNRGW